MHPDTLNFLSELMLKFGKGSRLLKASLGYGTLDFNCEVELDNTLIPYYYELYIFPKDRFITYEQSDGDWMSYFGLTKPGRGHFLGEIFEGDEEICREVVEEITSDYATVMTPQGPKKQLLRRNGYDYLCNGPPTPVLPLFI